MIGKVEPNAGRELPARADTPARIRDAAQQFEGLLIAQMLRAARESGGESWLGSGDDQAGESAVALAEEHLARALASRGGLGLTATIVAGLQKKQE